MAGPWLYFMKGKIVIRTGKVDIGQGVCATVPPPVKINGAVFLVWCLRALGNAI